MIYRYESEAELMRKCEGCDGPRHVRCVDVVALVSVVATV